MVDERKAVDVAYLNLREAFDIVSLNVLTNKLVKHGLGKQTG